ncbi:ParA family protein [Paenibacillus campi]|uniref:ParA family protein n=1 Tax=Paenibacillus campi TaxID=3106031 RepID=UPI002AFE9FFC|nr:ParA family protein [Paenibacillus sp. SGZ-1014]
MAPIQIVVCVEDQQYIELLLRYIRSSEYAAKVTIRAFSEVTMFMQYIAEERQKPLIVAEEVFLQAWRMHESLSYTRWVRLGELDELNADGYTVAKYQPLHHLLEQLCSFTGRSALESPRESGRAMITCLYSAVAGSGKSVTAMNMAKQLGLQGESVFYLNLEAMSSSGLLTFAQTNNMPELSRLLYDLQAATESKQTLAYPIHTYTIRAEEIRADTFMPPANVNEWLRMTVEEALRLIHYIADSGVYDHIIIDSESGWTERVQAALKCSDRIVWLLTDDLLCKVRTEQWLAYLQNYNKQWLERLEPKLSFVMNRYKGSIMNALPAGIQPDATLPDVPSWKQMTSSELLWCSPIFQRAILKLCRLDREPMHDAQQSAGGVGM